MGADTTLRVKRRTALLALAEIEFAHVTDTEIALRLTDRLRAAGEASTDVAILYFEEDSADVVGLGRCVEAAIRDAVRGG